MVGQDPVRSGGGGDEVAIRDEIIGRHPARHRRVELLGHPLQAPLAQMVLDPFQGRCGVLPPAHGASQLLQREYRVLREEILGCERLDLTIRHHSGYIMPCLETERKLGLFGQAPTGSGVPVIAGGLLPAIGPGRSELGRLGVEANRKATTSAQLRRWREV